MNHDELEVTARIDRRQVVIAQVEAALLAGRLEVSDPPRRATGTNPYDSSSKRPVAPRSDGWDSRRR